MVDSAVDGTGETDSRSYRIIRIESKVDDIKKDVQAIKNTIQETSKLFMTIQRLCVNVMVRI